LSSLTPSGSSLKKLTDGSARSLWFTDAFTATTASRSSTYRAIWKIS